MVGPVDATGVVGRMITTVEPAGAHLYVSSLMGFGVARCAREFLSKKVAVELEHDLAPRSPNRSPPVLTRRAAPKRASRRPPLS